MTDPVDDTRIVHRILSRLCDETDSGSIQLPMRSLCEFTDLSYARTRAAITALASLGVIEILEGRDSRDPWSYRITRDLDPEGGLTRGLRSRPEGAGDRKTSRDPPSESRDRPPARHPDRHCPMCEGTGWLTVNRERDIVDHCRCIGEQSIAHSRRRQRDLDRTWPATGDNLEPAKPDYTETWREHARRLLAGAPIPAPPDEPEADNVIPLHPDGRDN